MPTGYTAPIAEGITFERYAMTCARAFGATILLRDEPLSDDIPEFKASDYHAKALTIQIELLKRLEAMPKEEAAKEAAEEYQREIAVHEKRARESDDLRKKYEAMLVEVAGWQPPTTEHIELKKFMRTQIEESIKFDCHDYAEEEAPNKPDASAWRTTAIEDAKRKISYHADEQLKENERTASRNKWVRELRESLRTPAPTGGI